MMRRISAKRIAAVEPGVRYRTPAVDKMLNCGVTPLSLLTNATLIFIHCFKLYIRAEAQICMLLETIVNL